MTVIAAGFDRWDEARSRPASSSGSLGLDVEKDFGEDDLDIDGDDDFDVPSFLK